MAMRRPSMEPRRTAMAILVSVAVLGGCAGQFPSDRSERAETLRSTRPLRTLSGRRCARSATCRRSSGIAPHASRHRGSGRQPSGPFGGRARSGPVPENERAGGMDSRSGRGGRVRGTGSSLLARYPARRFQLAPQGLTYLFDHQHFTSMSAADGRLACDERRHRSPRPDVGDGHFAGGRDQLCDGLCSGGARLRSPKTDGVDPLAGRAMAVSTPRDQCRRNPARVHDDGHAAERPIASAGMASAIHDQRRPARGSRPVAALASKWKPMPQDGPTPRSFNRNRVPGPTPSSSRSSAPADRGASPRRWSSAAAPRRRHGRRLAWKPYRRRCRRRKRSPPRGAANGLGRKTHGAGQGHRG